MIKFLGPPPSELLQRGRITSHYFEDDGEPARLGRRSKLISSGTLKDGPHAFNRSFEDSITVMTGEEKAEFFRFVRRMLTWLPEERATAAELLADPWLEGS